jgi:hypothetical protein
MDGACSTRGRDEKCIQKFSLETLRWRDYSEDLDVDGKISEWILGKQCGKLWTGLIWLRIGISGGFL